MLKNSLSPGAPFCFLAFLFFYVLNQECAAQWKSKDPNERCVTIYNRIKAADDEARPIWIEKLYDLHHKLASDLEEDKADIHSSLALLRSASNLYEFSRAYEMPEEMDLYDVLEAGRKGGIRFRELCETSQSEMSKDKVNSNLYNNAMYLWIYGEWLREAHKLEKAILVLDEALSLNQTAVQPWIILTKVTILGILGHYEKRQEGLQRAEELARFVDKKYHDSFQINLAWRYYLHYVDIGVPELAAWWVERGQKIAEESNKLKEKGKSEEQINGMLHEVSLRNSLSQIAHVVDLAEEALREKNLSADMTLRFKIRWAFAMGELNLVKRAMLHDSLKNIDLPDFHLKRLNESRPKPNNLTNATKVLEEALGSDKLIKREELLAALILAKIQLDNGKPDSAAKWLKRAEEVNATSLEFNSKIGACKRGSDIAALRARMLMDSGASLKELKQALVHLGAEYNKMIDQLSSIPQRKGGVGFLFYDNRRNIVAELIRLHLLVEGEKTGAKAAFKHLLSAQRLGSLTRALNVEPAGLEQIQSMLIQEDHGILSYLPAPNRSYVFIVDSKSVEAVELPSERLFDLARKHLNKQLRRTHLNLEDPSQQKNLNRALRILSSFVLPPLVEAKLRSWKSVTIVGLNQIGWTPFECLPLSNGDEVGLTKAVDWLPSLDLGVHLLKNRSPLMSDKSDIAMFVAPEHEENMDQVQGALRPITISMGGKNRLKAAVHPNPLEFRYNAEASEENLIKASRKKIGLLCIFAHGATRKSKTSEDDAHIEYLERPKALILSPSKGFDGILTQDEVETKIQGAVVTGLFVCSAAKGPERFGDDGRNNLGGAFFLAGSQTVLHTQTLLEVESSTALAAYFVKNLTQQGMSPAKALKEARCSVASENRWAHPFFYSMLQVNGLGQFPVYQNRE